MKYRVKYQINTYDLFKIAMGNIYHSIIGVFNIIFTIAIIVAGFGLKDKLSDGFLYIYIVLCCVFLVFQPIAIYRRARAQAFQNQFEIEITFYDEHIQIQCEGKTQELKWSQIKKFLYRDGALILLRDQGQGFVIPNRALQEKKTEILDFIATRVAH